jgi:hypothetical protein
LSAGKDFSRVKPSLQLFAPSSDRTVDCPLAGFGTIQATPEQIAVLRRNPAPSATVTHSPLALKHADEQTVVGLAAVLGTIHSYGLGNTDFSDWGVVAAPCFLGRAHLAHSLQRMKVEGAWGISPHTIPHHSIHAISGTVSQALRIHGPNFGIGGGPGGMSEALIVAATLLAGGNLPGMWVVLTQHEPELIPLEPGSTPINGNHAASPSCIALAMALVSDDDASIGVSLHVCPQGERGNKSVPAAWISWKPLANVSALASALEDDGLRARKWRLGSTGWMELRACPDVAGPENGL